jgi:exonuclease III
MLEEGYTDCFRHLHPRAHGYTCATWMPAARIDYVFASTEALPRLLACDVAVGRGHAGREAATASDHFPLLADLSV